MFNVAPSARFKGWDEGTLNVEQAKPLNLEPAIYNLSPHSRFRKPLSLRSLKNRGS